MDYDLEKIQPTPPPYTMPEQRKVGFGEAIAMGFRKYAQFRGRSSRSEYWWWTLFCALVNYGLAILTEITGGVFFEAVQTVFGLAVFLPTLGVGVRRLHDVEKSGWIYAAYLALSLFVAFYLAYCLFSQNLNLFSSVISWVWVGVSIYFIILLCRPSDEGPNRYGPEPNVE